MANFKERTTYKNQSQPTRLDWDCIIRDILTHWWMILLAGLGAVLMTLAILQLRYTPVYTSESTFVIGRSGFSYSTISNNLLQAETTTKQYTQVVNSSILQKKVCEELNLTSFDAKVNVQTVPSSNLMVLQVTADSPRKAYLIGRSIISNAVELMGYFLDNVTMQELQQSLIPTEPSNPFNRRLYGERAALAGCLIMILILFLLSCYKDTIKNSEDVLAKIDAKLLGTIYFEKKHKSLSAILGRKKGSLLLTSPMLSFGYVEANHMLAARVRMALDRHHGNVLMVSSVSENEGKSTIAANIAVSLAEEGKRVLLIDCDFRKPAQYKIFEDEGVGERDFTEAISAKERLKIGHVKNIPGLYTLFCQKSRSKPWDKDSVRFIALSVEQLKKRVDYVLLDTSPIALVSDAEEYAAMADASLLVIRQDVMEACYINDAVDDLNNTGAPVIGCVLNGVRQGVISHTREYGHYGGSGYGRYSHYAKSRERGE